MKEIKTYRDLMKVLADGHTVEVQSVIDDRWITIKEFPFKVYKLDDELRFKHRIKPTKPSIDWSQVSDEFNYLARDKEGLVYLYGNKPKITEYDWWFVDDVEFVSASAFKSVEIGNCDWTESLVERPKD